MKLATHKIDIDTAQIHARQILKVVKNSSVNEPADYINPSISHIPVKRIKSTGVILKTMADHRHEVFINKLHERLAYEKNGTRIYDALIVKLENDLANVDDHQMDIDLMKEFRSQEAEHFAILSECIKKLGADPGVKIQSALEANVAAATYINIVTHPHTSIPQCIEAMLELELVDNAAWESLIPMAEAMGLSDMADEFRFALRQEEIHLITFREWYEELMSQFIFF